LVTKQGQPAWNIGIIGLCSLVGALLASYDLTAELLNVGAFIAFMGINLSAIRAFYKRRESGSKFAFITDCLAPALGLLFCPAIWCNLHLPAHI
jgi:amino acid transporter